MPLPLQQPATSDDLGTGTLTSARVHDLCSALSDRPGWDRTISQMLRQRQDGALAVLWLQRPLEQSLLFPWNMHFPVTCAHACLMDMRAVHEANIHHVTLVERWDDIARVVTQRPVRRAWTLWAIDELQHLMEHTVGLSPRAHKLPDALRLELNDPGKHRPVPLLRAYIRSIIEAPPTPWSLHENPWRMLDLPTPQLEALIIEHIALACDLILDGPERFETMRMFHNTITLCWAILWTITTAEETASGLLGYMEELHDALAIRLQYALFDR